MCPVTKTGASCKILNEGHQPATLARGVRDFAAARNAAVAAASVNALEKRMHTKNEIRKVLSQPLVHPTVAGRMLEGHWQRAGKLSAA